MITVVKALPVIDDGIVPPENFARLLNGIYKLFEKEHLPVAAWGQAGDGEVHLAPLMNVSQIGDRQTAFRLMEEYTNYYYHWVKHFRLRR